MKWTEIFLGTLILSLISIYIIIIIIIINKQSNIIDIYNNTTYNKDGIPNGGFLVSMLDLQNICSDYVSGKNDTKACAKVCITNLDIGNINIILNVIKDGGVGTNCFSLDTTYLRNDLSPYVFGPIPGPPPKDFVIGIIIDPRVIWEYIACMYVIDSGSIARYNTWDSSSDNGNFNVCKHKQCWDKYLNTINSKYLAFAGCGKMGQSQGLSKPASTFFANPSVGKEVHVPSSDDLSYNYWAWSPNNIPYSRYDWKSWIEKVKQIYPLTLNPDFINQQCQQQSQQGDGYRENEVDIIVPQTGKDPNTTCETTSEFVDVWRNSILGVFTNASTNCSNKNNIQNCFKCNMDVCCCNEDYSKNLVMQLVNSFNKKYNKKIKGYTMNTLGISDLQHDTHKLNIEEIKLK